MKLKILLVCICLSIAGIASFSNDHHSDTFALDDAVFQHYNGKTGRWIFAGDKARLNGYIHEFGSSVQEAAMLNPGTTDTYFFIPYSASYIAALGKEGYKETLHSASPDSWIWPVEAGIQISSSFGHRGSDFHTGIDIPAERGTLVRATKEGLVSFAGYNGGYGNSVDIMHLDNFMTRYGHNTVILVHQGIALSGSTGNSTGSHVHYEIRCDDVPLNPLEFYK
jgi:murein DD-endopeptidase MepM/ murein hydrolase activator NlpD